MCFVLKLCVLRPQFLYFLPSLILRGGVGGGVECTLHHLMQSYRDCGSTILNGGDDILAEVQQIGSLKIGFTPLRHEGEGAWGMRV